MFDIGVIKRWSFIIVMIAYVSFGAWAQTNHHLIQPQFQSFGGDLQCINGEAVRMLGIGQSDISSASMYSSTFNFIGDILEISGLEEDLTGEFGDGFVTLPLPDGFTAILASFVICDVGGAHARLALLDSLGDVVWEVYTELEVDFGSDPLYVHYVEGELIYVSDNIQSYFYNLDGKLTEPIELPVIYEKQMLLENGFVSSKDSVVYLLGSGFERIDSSVFASGIVEFDTITAGGLVVLTEDSLYVLDSSLNPARSIMSPATNFIKVMATSKSYWLVSDSIQIWQLDSNLQEPIVHEVGQKTEIRDALHIGDVLFVAGHTPTGQGNIELFCVRTDAGNPEFGIFQDAAIVDIELKDTVRYSLLYPPLNKKVDYGRIYVTIANEGTAMLDEVTIKFSVPWCPTICTGNFQLSWTIEDLGIEPGDTSTVFLDSLDLFCIPFVPTELCLWTTGPNGEPDANLSNDYFCKSIELITDIAVPSQHDQISVFPNPASSVLHIQMSAISKNGQLADIRLMDAYGRIVFHKSQAGEQLTIHTNNFAPGLYYVLIQLGTLNRVVKKVFISG